MDQKEQQERVMKMVNELAMKAVDLPPDQRAAFIKSEIDLVRSEYSDTLSSDRKALASSLEFADKMEEWVNALVAMIQASGSVSGRA